VYSIVLSKQVNHSDQFIGTSSFEKKIMPGMQSIRNLFNSFVKLCYIRGIV
jgi:hypothetical protein